MKRGRYPDLNGWGSYAELERKLQERDIAKPTIKSFVRLVKDSIYIPNARIYSFVSCHPHYTEPRLRMLASRIGILWVRENEDVGYSNRYFWAITEQSGEGILDKIKRLKTRQELEFLFLS